MAKVDITKMDKEELSVKASELRVEITDLTRGIRSGDVQNVRSRTLKRRELARVLTALNKPEVNKKSAKKEAK